MIARSVSVLSYQKKCIILLFRKNISATKNQSICRKYRYKSICITTQLTTSYWFHSLLCYCIYYMRKYLIHVTWAQGKIHYASLEEVSETFYDKQFTTVTTHKYVQNYYNEKCTYNVIIHWNLLYALKLWSCLNFTQKRRLKSFCLIKWLFIKVRYLLNVNVSLEAIF